MIMKIAVVFLASVVMIPRWSKADNPLCPDGGITKNKALKNLLARNGKAINWKIKFGESCESDLHPSNPVDPNGVKVVYGHNKVCYAVGTDDLSVWVLSKTTADTDKAFRGIKRATPDCTHKPPYQSLYLKQLDNKDTYMILNPQMAKLFFTTKLSGCDVFIANNQRNPYEPLVVHSNRNDWNDSRAERSRSKGADVDQILNTEPNYSLLVRVYQKPEDEDTQEVINAYKTNHNQVEMVKYNTAKPLQFFHFIGIFQDTTWKFFLKGDNGKIIWQRCLNSRPPSSCTIL